MAEFMFLFKRSQERISKILKKNRPKCTSKNLKSTSTTIEDDNIHEDVYPAAKARGKKISLHNEKPRSFPPTLVLESFSKSGNTGKNNRPEVLYHNKP